ncbi:MAG: hypothetical protein JRJ85_17400 [Deltaproteobacteria bacterium]|nr:hypothetical protein [Deltaproteobacteria bacterium]
MSPFRRLLIVAIAGISFLGCTTPVRHEMTTEFPALVLYAVGAPPATDGRARFRDIFCRLLAADPGYQGQAGSCENFLLRFNDEPLPGDIPQPPPGQSTRYRVMVVPGLFNECFADTALPFEKARESLNDHRFKIDELVVSGRSSSDSNADYIAAKIDNLELDQDERLVLIGHSKGAVDILHYLINYPKASQRVAAVVSVAGAINGSPLAAKGADIYTGLARYFFFGQCDTGDDGAINSLRPAVRMSWLAANPLPESVRYFSLAACTRRDNINMVLKTGYDLLWIYSPRNDGLLLISDQIIPGGTLLGYANADHWSVVLPLENKNLLISKTVQAPQKFPRKVLLQAILVYVAETLESKQE